MSGLPARCSQARAGITFKEIEIPAPCPAPAVSLNPGGLLLPFSFLSFAGHMSGWLAFPEMLCARPTSAPNTGRFSSEEPQTQPRAGADSGRRPNRLSQELQTWGVGMRWGWGRPTPSRKGPHLGETWAAAPPRPWDLDRGLRGQIVSSFKWGLPCSSCFPHSTRLFGPQKS